MSTSQNGERPQPESGRLHGDLPVRTYQFAVTIVRMFESIRSSPKSWVLAKQLLRSGTSIGANVHETSQALTDAKFVHRCSIAGKEACETGYWLDLCVEADLLAPAAAGPVRTEADELVRILSSIVRRCQLISKNKRRLKSVGTPEAQEVRS